MLERTRSRDISNFKGLSGRDTDERIHLPALSEVARGGFRRTILQFTHTAAPFPALIVLRADRACHRVGQQMQIPNVI